MRLGMNIVGFDDAKGPGGPGPELAAVGAAAETAGVGWISVMDHYFQVTPPPRERGGFSLCRLGFATDQPGP
ncbi:hypothetical protein [Streptomyces sp. NPDC093109]|uniref:hypothetical protein n=1 Tax=Streptomyces sp. NPDC093109 TaxID=3154977 RepID=UPI00344BDF21